MGSTCHSDLPMLVLGAGASAVAAVGAFIGVVWYGWCCTPGLDRNLLTQRPAPDAVQIGACMQGDQTPFLPRRKPT